MSGLISKKVKIENVNTGEQVELMASYGNWIKANRLCDKLERAGEVGSGSRDYVFTMLWVYLAARSAGLVDTAVNPAVTIDEAEAFFEVWDLFDEEIEVEPEGGEPSPFVAPPTTSED